MVNAAKLMLLPPAIVLCLPFHTVYTVLIMGVFGSLMGLTFWPWLAWRSVLVVVTSQRVGPFARSLMLLPWLLVVAVIPALAVSIMLVASVVVGFAMSCLAGWAVVSEGAWPALDSELFSTTHQEVHRVGNRIQKGISEELAFKNHRTPADLNPLHVIEAVLGWVLALVPAALAIVFMAVLKMVLNIFMFLVYVCMLIPELDAKLYPCLIVGSPLVLLAVLGVAPALMLLAAALSPLVALCFTGMYAVRAVYASYLAHYAVPAGTHVAWYWPVLPQAFQGGLTAISAADELYACIPGEQGHCCTPAWWTLVQEHGLYGNYFTNRFGHVLTPANPK